MKVSKSLTSLLRLAC